jgi:hypothetical protein
LQQPPDRYFSKPNSAFVSLIWALLAGAADTAGARAVAARAALSAPLVREAACAGGTPNSRCTWTIAGTREWGTIRVGAGGVVAQERVRI